MPRSAQNGLASEPLSFLGDTREIAADAADAAQAFAVEAHIPVTFSVRLSHPPPLR